MRPFCIGLNVLKIWYVTGEVGICLDVYDAVPTYPRE